MSDEKVAGVAAILTDLWDPVGVRDIDYDPEQEYVYEADAIVRLLAGGAGVDEIATYLTAAAEELGPPDLRRDAAVAEAIVRTYG